MSRREKKDAAMAWLERTNPLTGMTIRDLQNVFDCARNGDTQRLHWIFNEIESVNPVLLVCVERRASAVANFQWRVAERASQDGQLSAEQKDAVETFLGDIENLTEAFEHLDLAFFRGFAHCQPIWEKDGTVREISLLDSWKFVRQGGEWFFNPECTGFSSDMQSCANARLMTVTRRRPIDYPALGIHVRDAVGNRDWGRFLERHALPKPAVTMHQGATEEQRRDYLEAAECVENGQVSVWPFGSSLTDFAGGSRGVDPFKNFIEHQERRIVLLATGGTLMSLAESGTGTLAGNAQTDVWESIVARDSAVIAQAVTRSLVRPYLEHAFPGKTCAVEFGFDFTKQPTPKEVAEVAATLKTAGWRVDQGELEEATGFTLEKEEAPQPQIPGGFGTFANKVPAPSLQTTKSALQNAPGKTDAQGEGQEPPALLGPFLRALQGDCKLIADEVEELLKAPTPEKARALLDKIPDLVPEDPALAPLLAEEMAKAYGEAFTKAQPVATNKQDAQGNEHDDGNGQFTEKTGGSSGTPSETTEKPTHTPEQQKRIEEYHAAVDQKALAWREAVMQMDEKAQKKEFFQFGEADTRMAGDIKTITGIDTEGWPIKMQGNHAVHIDKRHGAQGKADHSMADPQDFARIGYAMKNYDDIIALPDNSGYRSKDNQPAKQVELRTRIDGTMAIQTVVPDSKAQTLLITSTRIEKAKG